MRVLTGLALWGLAEIAALVVVGARIGVPGVLSLVLGTGAFGVLLLRRQGVQAVRAGLRVESLGDHGLRMFAGVLLVLPGLLSDLAGAVLLLPPIRRRVAAWLAARIKTERSGEILDGVAVELERPRLASTQPSGWTRP